MFSCSCVKVAFCFAVINSVAAITLKTINDARAELLDSTSLKRKFLTILDGDLKTIFNLQHGKVFSIYVWTIQTFTCLINRC